MSTYRYYAPQCSYFGYGCLSGLGDEIVSRGYGRALIVTDPSICRLGIANKVTAVLDKVRVPYSIYGEVKPNPTVDNVENGLQVLRRDGCDFIITVGGGSSHDCGKAISILAVNGGSIGDYRGFDKSAKKGLDLIAINTTAGTGSECTRAYVITDEKTQSKSGIRDKHALAAVAVNDHELMMSLPKSLTAGTGMDALTHAVECYVSKNGFLLTSELAMTAIRVIFRHLRDAVEYPDNEKAREGMAVAEYLAGLAFGNGGVGLVHSMSHQLSAVYDLPHGLCNAILLPAVMSFNKSACPDRFADIGKMLDPAACAEKSDEKAANIAIQSVINLSEAVGTRRPLRSLGVLEKDFDLLAQKALADGSLVNNPVQPTKEQVIELYRSVY